MHVLDVASNQDILHCPLRSRVSFYEVVFPSRLYPFDSAGVVSVAASELRIRWTEATLLAKAQFNPLVFWNSAKDKNAL
jgi:hypothetical protein